MSLSESNYNNYCKILKEELIPAIGCTEPTCVAFGCAKVSQVLGEFPDRLLIESSGNIIKNVKGAVVPNSGNLRGIRSAAIIGIVGGNADKELEVLSNIKEKDIEKALQILKTDFCTVKMLDTNANLHLIVTAWSKEHTAIVEIMHTHTNIVRIEKDGVILVQKEHESENFKQALTDRTCLNVKDIKEFADTVELDELKPLIKRQIRYNSKISEEGMSKHYGAGVGASIGKHCGDDVRSKAKASAAAGSDARMSGCILPVIINSGSGNQGITVSMPVIEYAKHLKVSEEKLIRALIFSNLIAIHQKTGIGRLSAYCGVVSAACGSGAAITYLCGGTYDQICKTITNTLADVGGMVCDGAKPSCAAKIATAVGAAILAHDLSMDGNSYGVGEGLVKSDVEKTIEGFGYLGRVGMKETDREIIKIMIDEC